MYWHRLMPVQVHLQVQETLQQLRWHRPLQLLLESTMHHSLQMRRRHRTRRERMSSRMRLLRRPCLRRCITDEKFEEEQ